MLFLSSQDMLLSLYNVNSISSGSHPSSTPSPLNQVAGPVLGWRWAGALGLHACPPPGNRDCPRKRLPPALAFCWHDFKRGRSPGVVVGWDLRPEGLTALFFSSSSSSFGESSFEWGQNRWSRVRGRSRRKSRDITWKHLDLAVAEANTLLSFLFLPPFLYFILLLLLLLFLPGSFSFFLSHFGLAYHLQPENS